MTPGRLSPRSEFTPVPSHSSTFVHMIPPQNVVLAQREFTPVVVPGREFHSGKKSRNGTSVENRSNGGLERVAYA